MVWQLMGEYYESCSCEAMCPCSWSVFAHAATRDDYCRFAMAFEVERGDVEGVDVSGTTFVLVGDAPPQMTDGNWKVGVIVDEGASEEQVASLGRVLTGELGGPPAALGPLLGEFLGVERAAVSIDGHGGTHRVRVGNGIDFSGQRVMGEGGEQVTFTGIAMHPAGPTLGVAPVSSANVSAFGFEYSGQDLSGFANPFNWSG
jgi:hypothetical protein